MAYSPLKIGDIIEHAIASTGNSDEYYRQQACYLWPEIVGPQVNRLTTRRWVDRDVMHVCITSGVLKNELSFHRDSIVSMLNAALGRPTITSLVIH